MSLWFKGIDWSESRYKYVIPVDEIEFNSDNDARFIKLTIYIKFNSDIKHFWHIYRDKSIEEKHESYVEEEVKNNHWRFVDYSPLIENIDKKYGIIKEKLFPL